METGHYKSILNAAPFGYAHHVIILDKFNSPIDYIFLEINAEFENLTGLDSSKILNKRVTEVLPDIKKEPFNWIAFYGEVALNGGEKEFEQYSEPLSRWYRIKVFSIEKLHFTTIFTDITKEKVISTTSSLLSEKPDYLNICDTFLTISNAKYVFLNVLEPLSNEFNTAAHTKINSDFEHLVELLGFGIKGNKWKHYPETAKKVNDKITIRFNCLKDFTGDTLPLKVVSKVEKLLRTGEVLIIKLVNDEELLGNFTVIMQKGDTLKNESLVEIYARQIGLYLARFRSERLLEQFFTVNLDLLCIADQEGNFIKVSNAWTEILGFSSKDLEQRKFLDFVHPDDIQSTLKAMNMLQKQQKVVNFVNRYRTKDGEYRHIEWRSHPQGNLIYAAARDITKRINVENRLRISEEKYRSLVTQSLEMLYLHDLEGNLLEVNKEAMLKTGYSKNELLSMNVFDLHPDKSSREQIISQWESWELDQSYTIESTHQRKDGKVFPVEISTGKILIGNQELILALCRDITRKKVADNELKTSEARFRSLFEQSNDAVLIIDLEGRHVAANLRAAEMFGYTQEEIENLSFRDTSAEAKSSADMLRRLIQGEKIPLYERTFRKKNGDLIFCEVNVELVRDANGNPMHIQSIVRDISERKKAEEVLFKTKEMLEQTSLLVSLGGWEKNLENGEDNWSETTRAIYEVDRDFVPNMENTINFHKEGDREKIKIAVENLIKTGQPYDLELQIITAKNQEKWIRTIGNAEFKDGKCVRIYGVFQDIDERKKIELALGESREELSELNATKDKFFTIIAHDLKSVFNGILGFTEMLVSDPVKNNIGMTLKYSGLLNDVARSGHSLLDNLLQWARVKTGRIEFTPSMVPLDNIIQDILNVYKLNIKEKDIDVNVYVPDNQKVFADASMLETILRNLISNAIKFTNRGGSISIEVTGINGEATISVRDTGVGISDDIIPLLFRIDGNISSMGTNNEQGTGLGLILCKEFVEKHGGKIWLDSKPGTGSTFTFTLPEKPV
jgi:PAS domain S-box-containing protein